MGTHPEIPVTPAIRSARENAATARAARYPEKVLEILSGQVDPGSEAIGYLVEQATTIKQQLAVKLQAA